MRRIVILSILLLMSLGIGVNTSCDDQGRLLGLSSGEIVEGLKAALRISADTASRRASAEGGYLHNALIRIPLPAEVQPVADLLAKADGIPAVGSIIKSVLADKTEDFVRAMNRAAELAARPAGGIFVGAIRQMTISDGLRILQGSDTAATAYLREKTGDSLVRVFTPVVREAIGQAEVMTYWNALASGYNELMSQLPMQLAMPLIRQQVPNLPSHLEVDLPTYVTGRGVDGLYTLMKGEEQKIRRDPMQYASDIVRKVFSSDEARGRSS